MLPVEVYIYTGQNEVNKVLKRVGKQTSIDTLKSNLWLLRGAELSLLVVDDKYGTISRLNSSDLPPVSLTDAEAAYIRGRLIEGGYYGILNPHVVAEVENRRITTAVTRILVWLLGELPSSTNRQQELHRSVKNKLQVA